MDWHDAYVAVLHVAGRRVTAQRLRLGYEVFPLVVREAKDQRESHARLHKIEGEPADCDLDKCSSAQKDVRAHARLVRRLESKEAELDRAIAPIRASPWPPLGEKQVLKSWQRQIGPMCHHLHSVGGLTDRQIGLLRTLAEGLPPLFSTVKARAASSKEAWRAFEAKTKAGK